MINKLLTGLALIVAASAYAAKPPTGQSPDNCILIADEFTHKRIIAIDLRMVPAVSKVEDNEVIIHFYTRSTQVKVDNANQTILDFAKCKISK